MTDPAGLPPHRPRSRRRAVQPPPGSSPGLLPVDPQAQPSVLTAIGYGPEGCSERQAIGLADVAQWRRRWPVVWLDVTGFRDVELMRGLGEQFGLHRLALEDVLNLQQRAKAEDFGTHEFLVLRMVDPHNPHETEQLGLFVGQGFVLTFQQHAGDSFDPVRRRMQDRGGQMQKRGSDYLAYALLDAVVDAYFPLMEELDARLERVEESILGRRGDGQAVAELHSVRRCMLHLRRALWPLREATSSLVRGEVRHFSPEVAPYLRDVHDHVVQLLDLLESCRELGSSLLELHLSAVNHRLNEVMKVLTIIATIFIPLTFVAGIYGMNFDWMPELRVWWAYPATLLLMAATAGAMLLWFRRRGWL